MFFSSEPTRLPSMDQAPTRRSRRLSARSGFGRFWLSDMMVLSFVFRPQDRLTNRSHISLLLGPVSAPLVPSNPRQQAIATLDFDIMVEAELAAPMSIYGRQCLSSPSCSQSPDGIPVVAEAAREAIRRAAHARRGAHRPPRQGSPDSR